MTTKRGFTFRSEYKSEEGVYAFKSLGNVLNYVPTPREVDEGPDKFELSQELVIDSGTHMFWKLITCKYLLFQKWDALTIYKDQVLFFKVILLNYFEFYHLPNYFQSIYDVMFQKCTIIEALGKGIF